MKITVQYHAMLRDQRGLSEETVKTDAATAADLYEALQLAHALELPKERLWVAINHEKTAWDTRLQEGDVVVFIPPVAGG